MAFCSVKFKKYGILKTVVGNYFVAVFPCLLQNISNNYKQEQNYSHSANLLTMLGFS